jgi:thiol-disulfide isomerase/thioredoxin
MSVFQRIHMPSLDGATGWLNSEPLGPAELRGRVVLVNFWTWTCINWLRQEPYVRAWSRAYRDDGLVVVGVHTPEFSFEHEVDGVRRAVEEREIDYPVAVDNDYEVWSAFANHFWPALYFVDREGLIRDQHFGEGRYEESERVIQQLLGVDREPVFVEGQGVEAAADWNQLGTPDARDANLVLSRGAGEPIPFRVLLDGEALGPSHGVDVDEGGNGLLGDGRMYQLVRQHDAVRERTLEITFLEAGAEAYSFTFG